jgi:hypothetical protein
MLLFLIVMISRSLPSHGKPWQCSRYSYGLQAGRLRGSRLESRGSISSRPALGSTQPPFQSVPGTPSSEVKGGKGVLLTTRSKYVPMAKNVDLHIRDSNTSFAASCLTKLSTRVRFTLLLLTYFSISENGWKHKLKWKS